eukprot:Sspe_Gene.84723::Locus_55622_Transcript_1_1_Confidence_1.000_Length_729::g.84723::m.84723
MLSFSSYTPTLPPSPPLPHPTSPPAGPSVTQSPPFSCPLPAFYLHSPARPTLLLTFFRSSCPPWSRIHPLHLPSPDKQGSFLTPPLLTSHTCTPYPPPCDPPPIPPSFLPSPFPSPGGCPKQAPNENLHRKKKKKKTPAQACPPILPPPPPP